MQRAEMTAVLGLGNELLSDDAVGLQVAEALERLLADDPLPGVVVQQSTRAGFELLDLLSGYGSAVIIDALDVPVPQPGRVRELSLENFAGSARLNNPHELSVGAAFALARKLRVPMPENVIIYGVECADLRTISVGLSEDVAAVVEPLAREIHARLKSEYRGNRSTYGGDAVAVRPAFYPPGE